MIPAKMIPIAAAIAVGLAGAAQAADGRSADTVGEKAKDLMTEARINTAYALNEHLSAFTIDVDVHDDSMTLTGEVENEAQRELAERLAKDMSGIGHVENALKTEPDAGGSTESELLGFVDDANTTARVDMLLLWNDATSGLNIDVDTQGGIVTLTGKVSSEEERAAAERIAERTDGVTKVRNKLEIAPEETLGAKTGEMADKAVQTLSDAWITTRVSASLRFSDDIDHEGIDVSTQDGVVTIQGAVKSPQDKAEATDIARGISGVKQVDNQLTIAAPTAA